MYRDKQLTAISEFQEGGAMITQKEYKKYPEEYWIGKKVRTLLDIENGYITIPKGFILRIDRKYQGFSLSAIDVCPHCGIGRKISISRVKPYHLELIEDKITEVI